jgi:hypothetical protein
VPDSHGGQGGTGKGGKGGEKSSPRKRLPIGEARAKLEQLEKETEQEPAVLAIKHMIAHGIHLVALSASGKCNLHLDKVEIEFPGDGKQKINVLSCHAKLLHEFVQPQETVPVALVSPFKDLLM